MLTIGMEDVGGVKVVVGVSTSVAAVAGSFGVVVGVSAVAVAGAPVVGGCCSAGVVTGCSDTKSSTAVAVAADSLVGGSCLVVLRIFGKGSILAMIKI